MADSPPHHRAWQSRLARKIGLDCILGIQSLTQSCLCRLNITIDHATTANGSEHSSITDEEDSSGTGVQVSPSSTSGSQEYPDPLEEEEGWGVVYADDIGPSDSASRPRTSNQHRPVVEAPNPEVARRQTSRRQSSHGRIPLRPRVHQQRPRASPESVDSNEDWPGYARGPPPPHGRAYWPPMAGAVAGALPPSHAPSYSGHGYHPYTNTSIIPAGQQLVPFANQPYGYSPYQPAPAPNAPTYFGQGGAPGYGHPGAPPMANPITTHGGSPFSGQEMTHHGASPGYFPFPPQAYSMPQPIPPIYHHYTPVYSPPPQVNTPPPPSDSGKDDEKFARIEKLFLDQKAELEAKEAAARKAADDKAARDEAEKEVAGMVAAAAAEAAAAAKDEAEKKAAEEAAAKEKALADEKTAAEAAAAASAAAAAAAAPPPPPEEKKKPIKFKDAVGRKFSFPFHLCNTWEVRSLNTSSCMKFCNLAYHASLP